MERELKELRGDVESIKKSFRETAQHTVDMFELVKKIDRRQDAYNLEASSKKSEYKQLYAELFRQAAATEARDPANVTAGQLQAKLHAAADRLAVQMGAPVTIMAPVRKLLWTELTKVLPVESTPLDGRRDEVAAAFLKLSDLLKKVP